MTEHWALHSEPFMIVVTGIQAAGKSTVAHLLARRFSRGVHVEADALQHMIVSGGEWMTEPGEPGGEVASQLRLRLKHMCLLGISFFEAGFTVVLDDIILADRWHDLCAQLQGYPFVLVVLAPRALVVAEQRDRSRAKSPLGMAWAYFLDRSLRETMSGVGYWIDTSDQAPEDTVDHIVNWLRPELNGSAATPDTSDRRESSMTDNDIQHTSTCYIEQFPHALPHRMETVAPRPCGHWACDPHTITYYGTGEENDAREGDYCMVCYERTFPGMCPDRTLRAAIAAESER